MRNNGVRGALEISGRGRWAQISTLTSFRGVFGRKNKRKKNEGKKNPKGLELSLPSLAGTIGREEGEGWLYKRWVWATPSLKLGRVKTLISGARMRSTKKEKVFIMKSSFQMP